MAGIFVPSIVVVIAFAVFATVRFGYHVDVPIERIIVFPLALVPNVWGLWNIMFVRMHSKRWLPLGLHGAILPLFLSPAGYAVATWQGFELPTFAATGFLFGMPVALIIYYLVWKHVVGFFNHMLGIA
jgi:hypothetical protein